MDTALALPVVRGDSAVDNSLIASDLDGTIRATFPIYAGRTTTPGTEFIDLYYGFMDGTAVGTYGVTGTEPEGTMISITIASDIIESYGNGEVPCWYRVRNANNYKESRKQNVNVNVFSLDGLADPVFTNLFTPPPPSTDAPFISCEQIPWVGVPIRIFDPVTLQDGDTVVIHAVRYLYSGVTKPPTPVAGSEINSPPIGIGPSERINGFTYNFALNSYFDGGYGKAARLAGSQLEHHPLGAAAREWNVGPCCGEVGYPQQRFNRDLCPHHPKKRLVGLGLHTHLFGPPGNQKSPLVEGIFVGIR